MIENAVSFLESSFLKDALKEKGITDISYNGESFYCASNVFGRRPLAVEAKREEVGSFLRQIANITERQFSYSVPILDVSFGRYRLNAVFPSLARVRNEKSYSFSLRLASEGTVLEGNDQFFGGTEKLLLQALEDNESLVIGGQTSSGKTELEKWCLLHLNENKRVIVIDNVEELDMVENPSIDLTTWLVNDSLPEATFDSLIKNALRNNPDYIIVAESRGKEMLDAITSALSGHPIITTIHAKNLAQMPERMARLAMLSNERLSRDELIDDIAHHFRYFVYLEKSLKEDGHLCRFIQSIGRYEEKSQTMEVLYERNKS
jgi:pilus assembly protein CpaF